MKKALKIVTIFLNVMLIFSVCLASFALFYLLKLNSTLSFDKNKLELANLNVEIYDENNEIINTSDSKKIDIENLNDYTIFAFVSIEDKEFFNHNGVNYKRILGAFLNNLKTKSLSQGASTISQQLIKNTHLTNEKTISRKVKEILLTKKMESELSKKQIMETYLNVIYFGESAFGIEQASLVFFNKPAKELSIAESATLAGIIKSPAKYSPIYNKENCIKRRNLVLKEMYEDFYINKEEYEEAVNSEINLNLNEKAKCNYNNLYIKQTYLEAQNILGITEKEMGLNGFKIYTYQNPTKQKILEEKIGNESYYLKNKYGNTADSLGVVINAKTGGIEAYSGKSDNDLVNIKRQPGSSIKPQLVYAPALEYGLINPTTPILDEKIDYDGYSPNNLGNVFHGYVSAKKCVADSLNIPAVKLMSYLGIEKCKNFAKNLNIEFDENDNGYAIALGGFTKGVRLIDLASSYAPFINNGQMRNAKFIKKIVSNTGLILYENKENSKKVMGEDSAYLMHNMLVEGVKNGTSRALRNLDFEVAGKTGTVCVKNSNNNTDAISVAYTSEDIMGVWFGNTSYKKEYELTSKTNGGTYPTYVIRDTFLDLYKNDKPENISVPESIVSVNIDMNELKNNNQVVLASEYCPERYKENILVSKRYMPNKAQDNYNNFDITNFDAKLIDDKVLISFDTLNYVKYKIVRINNGKKEVINTVENKSGKYEFVDETINNNTTYKYRIEAIYEYLHSTKHSTEIEIITNKYKTKYVDILNAVENNIKNDSKKTNNWYFVS